MSLVFGSKATATRWTLGFAGLVLATAGQLDAQVFTGLGDLSGGSFYSFASGISADGSAVVGMSNSSSGTEAFRWTSSGMAGLGDLPGGSFYSQTQGVSSDGSAVVGDSSSGSGGEAFI